MVNISAGTNSVKHRESNIEGYGFGWIYEKIMFIYLMM